MFCAVTVVTRPGLWRDKRYVLCDNSCDSSGLWRDKRYVLYVTVVTRQVCGGIRGMFCAVTVVTRSGLWRDMRYALCGNSCDSSGLWRDKRCVLCGNSCDSARSLAG